MGRGGGGGGGGGGEGPCHQGAWRSPRSVQLYNFSRMYFFFSKNLHTRKH